MPQRTPLLIVNSHPIQYFAPLYRRLGSDPAFDLTVLYCSRHGLAGEVDRQFGTSVQWDIPLLEGYHHRFLANQSWRPSIYGFWGLVNWSVIGELWRTRRGVVVVYGWAYAVTWITILFAKLLGHTVCLRAESPINYEERKTPGRQRFRSWLLGRGLFQFIDYFLYIGQQNSAFYKYMGVAPGKMIYSPYAVDNSRFQAQANTLMPQRNKLRTALGITTNQLVLLYCGKYIKKKRPLDLLKAASQLPASRVFIILMGDGEMRPALQAFIDEKKMANVLLTGFVNQSYVGQYFTMADAFVICSDEGETWGLATNEAMNFSLPVVIADAVGCANDLVESAINGYTYPCGNIDALTDRLARLLAMPAEQHEIMGRASLERINQYSYEQTVTSLKATFCPSAR